MSPLHMKVAESCDDRLFLDGAEFGLHNSHIRIDGMFVEKSIVIC